VKDRPSKVVCIKSTDKYQGFQKVNALIPALFIMAIVLGAYLGHRIGYRWVVMGKERLLRPTYLGVLAAVSALVLVNYPAPRGFEVGDQPLWNMLWLVVFDPTGERICL
jgi:hypothetical protein